MDTHVNPRPSSPISISSTDGDDGFTSIANDLPSAVAIDDACASIRHQGSDMNPAAQRPTANANAAPPAVPVTTASTSAAAHTGPAAGGQTFAQQPAVGSGPAVVADPLIAPPAEGSHTLPVHSDERWYCVTVGRQVGVFQGLYVLFH
jgi:hypothetical protein